MPTWQSPMDQWPYLRAFIRSVRAGSFTAAAREAGTTPSAFSKMVGKLEASLGVRLLTRGAHGLELTPEGEELFERGQRACDDIEEAVLRVTPARAWPLANLCPLLDPMRAAPSFLGLFVPRASPIASLRCWPARFCLS